MTTPEQVSDLERESGCCPNCGGYTFSHHETTERETGYRDEYEVCDTCGARWNEDDL